jgi:hypothetical protein
MISNNDDENDDTDINASEDPNEGISAYFGLLDCGIGDLRIGKK